MGSNSLHACIALEQFNDVGDVRCYNALVKCNQLGQTTYESKYLMVVGLCLYWILSTKLLVVKVGWNTQSELSSYLIVSTMMMITGSRMISPTSTTTTAAIVMDPPSDTKTILH